MVYVARASGTPRGADDAKNATLCDPRNPPTPLAFDHAEILADYVHWLDRRRISRAVAQALTLKLYDSALDAIESLVQILHRSGVRQPDVIRRAEIVAADQ